MIDLREQDGDKVEKKKRLKIKRNIEIHGK
jgi:hypothetical protein